MRQFSKTAALSAILCGVFLLTCTACGKKETGELSCFRNLAAAKGVTISADGELSEGQSAGAAADGREDTAWVMNLPEDAVPETAAEHVLTVTWKKEKAVSFVRTVWGDLNCFGYRIEGSADGGTYETLYESKEAPYLREDLAKIGPGMYRSIRLIVRGGANLCEIGLYEKNPFEALLGIGEENPIVPELREENGVTRVCLEGLPEEVEVNFAGCDLEQVVDAQGIVQDTIADIDVRVGFCLSRQGWNYETPAYTLRIPAAAEGTDTPAPAVVPALKEWRGGSGTFTLNGRDLVIETDPAGKAWDPESADVMLQTLKESCEAAGCRVILPEDAGAADESAARLWLSLTGEEALGTEGYHILIEENDIQVSAHTQLGLWWAAQTLRQLPEKGADGIPCGEIRDYPTYPVRGFEIDAARKALPMETLYEIAEKMAAFKMNELTIHLNDNEILAYSGRLDSVENALTSYAAFRMESSIAGPEGTALQAQDFFYTAGEFDELVRFCAQRGITVIPELDMPAHSLSITRAFPELSIAATYGRPDSVDELDVGKEETFELAERIWTEQLTGTRAFADCPVLHIGGDEYYGIDDFYINFMNRLASALKNPPLSDCNAPGITREALDGAKRRVRAWASLSEIRGMGRVPGSLMELCLWSTLWADPQTMYRAGHDLINARSDLLYIVPGTGADRFDTERFEREFDAAAYVMPDGTDRILPAYSPQLRGAQFTLWNDTAGTEAGADQEEILERFGEALIPFSGKIW